MFLNVLFILSKDILRLYLFPAVRTSFCPIRTGRHCQQHKVHEPEIEFRKEKKKGKNEKLKIKK